MEFASFEVQIGAACFRPISNEQISLHTLVAQKFTETSVTRSGSAVSIPVDHHEAVHNAGGLAKRWTSEFSAAYPAHSPKQIDLVILDFLSSSFYSLREPLLIALATGLGETCRTGVCHQFILLLPKMPGASGAFRGKIQNFGELVGNLPYSISLIARDGQCQTYAEGEEKTAAMDSPFSDAVDLAYGNYEKRLEKKCVRRLGHFPSFHPGTASNKCRHYSHYLHDCGYELTSFFRSWWDTNCPSAQSILYDLPTNELLREVVVAHSSRIDISAERILDVIENEGLSATMRAASEVVLVLDVVDTGTTLKRYVEQLSELGIRIAPHVFVAISKKGKDHRFQNPNLQMHGLIVRPSEALADRCPQCSLRLPLLSDAGEELFRLRSYDLLFMISEVGWTREREEEVPGNIGGAYTLIPNFSAMLDRFGDWIAYKLFNGLRAQGLPEAWFAIHPDEADSSALSERLNDCTSDELTIVRVPRNRIKEAQAAGNNWGTILAAGSAEHWAEQLRNMRGASALVLDIFNGSDSTCKSLVALVNQFNLVPLAYACVVDFKPDREIAAIDDVPKLALYEWNSPRVLHSGNN